MTAEAPQAQENAYDRDREGARWINRKPSGAEFAAWFTDNVKIDDALELDKYIGGVVLIPAKEYVEVVVSVKADGDVVTNRIRQMTYTPYPKVETRIEYFWDLLEARRDEWYGVVEPVESPRPSTEPVKITEQILDGDRMIDRERFAVAQIHQTIEQLPPGFFIMTVPVQNTLAHYLGCSYKVEIRERDGDRVVRSGRGTKTVPLITEKTWSGNTTIKADDNAVMKAETGAKGRALGFAGIFNIPGSGVATAEDMMDALAGPTVAPQSDSEAQAPPADQTGPAAPEAAPQRTAAEAQADEHQALIERAKELVKDASDNYPGVLDEFREWGAKRNPPIRNLNQVKGAALRGVIKKLEKLIEEAKARAAERGDEPEAAQEPQAEPETPAGGDDAESSGS